MRNRLLSGFCLVTLLLVSVVTAWGVEPTGLTIDPDQPVEISASQLEVIEAEQLSVFSGDVVVVQGDMTMTSDRLKLYSSEDQAGKRQIERLEAYGSVRFVKLDQVATADKATYRQRDEVLLLQGNAQVSQGQDRVSGDEITLYVRENRSLVTGSSTRRVKALITPKAQQEKSP